RVGRVVDDVDLAPRLDNTELAGRDLALDLEGEAVLRFHLEGQLDHLVAGDRARGAAGVEDRRLGTLHTGGRLVAFARRVEVGEERPGEADADRATDQA